MKARGYDPLTIQEAERKMASGVAAMAVCAMIEKAFAGVTLGEGVGLLQARGLDDYADEPTLKALRAEDEKEDWHHISEESLQYFHDTLSFFDAEGMRFHLPAFLLWDLQTSFSPFVVYSLTNTSSYSQKKFSLLSPSQRAAVRTYLLHILEDPEYRFEHENIRRALVEYWTETN